MKDVPATNLRAMLKSRVTDDRLASRALRHFEEHSADVPALTELLRDHVRRSVSDPVEIGLREGFDRLLAAWSVVEIGVSVGAYPDPVPDPLAVTMRSVLGHPAVRAFYEEHYPLPLIVRLAERVHSTNVVVATSDSSDAAVFRTFVDLDSGFAEDAELGVFLKLLDSFHWGEVRLEMLVAHASTAESFGRMVAGGDGIEPRLMEGARGFLEFLSFAARLDALLERAGPGLTHAISLHYTYWFEAIGQKTNGRLGSVLSAIETWQGSTSSHPDDVVAFESPSTREIRHAMDRLIEHAGTAVAHEAGRSSSPIR